MGDGYNFETLRREILKLSKATDWEAARREWRLTHIYEEPGRTCLCEHHPITDICVIRNGTTGHAAEVGNVCVKRFLGIRSDLIFAGVKRVRLDPTKALNADAIVFFHRAGIINDWEYSFLQSTKRKRSLTAKQANKRLSINQRVIRVVETRGIQGYTTFRAPQSN